MSNEAAAQCREDAAGIPVQQQRDGQAPDARTSPVPPAPRRTIAGEIVRLLAALATR